MRPACVLAVAIWLLSVWCVGCGDGGGNGGNTPTSGAPSLTAMATAADLRTIELDYGGGTLRVEVAETAEERYRGLSGRASLAEDAGMLFVLEETRVPSFSMRGMRFGLDFIWIDEAKRVIGITSNVEAPNAGEVQRSYSPEAPVRYLLEVNGGTAERLGITIGDRFMFSLE